MKSADASSQRGEAAHAQTLEVHKDAGAPHSLTAAAPVGTTRSVRAVHLQS